MTLPVAVDTYAVPFSQSFYPISSLTFHENYPFVASRSTQTMVLNISNPINITPSSDFGGLGSQLNVIKYYNKFLFTLGGTTLEVIELNSTDDVLIYRALTQN